MWVARLKVWHANSYVAEKTKNLDVAFSNFYLNTFDKDGKTHLSRVALVYGKDAEKLIRIFKSDRRLRVEEVIGHQVFFTMPATNVFHPLLMDRSVFFVRPVIGKQGTEFWTVGSHRKEDLKRLFDKINALRPEASAEWISLKQERLDLFTPNAVSRLSEKQRWAFKTALEGGYYQYPRNATLEQLAKRAKVPATTFRIHLRKAEEKLMLPLGQALGI